MDYSIFDLEGDGVRPSKIYCVCVNKFVGGKCENFTLTDYNAMRKFFLNEKILIGHNIIRWDIPQIERLLNIKITAKLIDTLALSWYLYPKRSKHGLAVWGKHYGVKKPEIEDWDNLPLETYIHRCQEDIKINTLLFKDQINYLIKLYSGNDRYINKLMAYLSFKLKCAAQQEQVGWRLDIEKCKSNLEELVIEREQRLLNLVRAMPLHRKYRTMAKPKVMYKKDGSLSSHGVKWQDILAERGLPMSYEENLMIETSCENGNPSSHDQVKKWLYSLNWNPATFKFVRDKNTNVVKKIPQISKPFGGGICKSIKRLYDVQPELKNLEGLYVIEHRIGILKGFLNNVDERGYLKAEIHGLTNTLRFKHTVIVNLPGVNKPYGKHIRECLIAEPGMILCGSDMSSLEDRTKQHYMFNYDPEYVRKMMTKDFDPHLDLAESDGALTQEQVTNHKSGVEDHSDIRTKYKTVNYAAIYGSGAKTMSSSSNMSVKEAQKLIIAYWKKNWAVKKVANSLTVKTVNNQRWLFNPVNHLWYTLRVEKDKFSTLNQGTGTYCFDVWVENVLRKGVTVCGQFHDEIIFSIRPQDKEYVREILYLSISETNSNLLLNRDLDIDIQFGDNYSQIH